VKLNITSSMVVWCGDCRTEMKKMKKDHIDLIITSPPYADRRKGMYDSVHPDEYVKWFIPITEQMLRILKPTGSFILNIKEPVINRKRHPCVDELKIEMRKSGWELVDTLIWHKTTCMPGKFKIRTKDAWEYLIHFAKDSSKVKVHPENVKIPIKSSSRKRNVASASDKRENSSTGSKFGKNRRNFLDKELVLPSNVLHGPPETRNRSHPAVYPEWIPEWFIKYLTDENDLVLDPFVGSGTTLKAAYHLNRRSVGIEVKKEFIPVIERRVHGSQKIE
jgi:site-specific DNA-methyltransferase (adenine-specific)